MDRISNMPDSVLCHILSFLATEDAVTTSILSRRWRHLWKHLQVFDFSDSSFEDNPTSFTPFVNSVLAGRRTRDFMYFRLASTLGFATFDDIDSWIGDVAGPNLEELTLLIDTPEDGLPIPPSYFTCKKLAIIPRASNMCQLDFD